MAAHDLSKFPSRPQDCARKYPLICQYAPCSVPFWGWSKHQRYHSKTCSGAAKRLTDADFWALVKISDDPGGCWEWQGPLCGPASKAHRYGQFRHNGAHRYAYQQYHPDEILSEDDEICHTCDNCLCVRKEHLFKGTRTDNIHDAQNKGRLIHGERHPFAKLTEAQVREILARWKVGNITQKALAHQYDVSQTLVSQIVRGIWWKHIFREAL